MIAEKVFQEELERVIEIAEPEQKGVCPGGDKCPYPDILCNECELEIVD